MCFGPLLFNLLVLRNENSRKRLGLASDTHMGGRGSYHSSAEIAHCFLVKTEFISFIKMDIICLEHYFGRHFCSFLPIGRYCFLE